MVRNPIKNPIINPVIIFFLTKIIEKFSKIKFFFLSVFVFMKKSVLKLIKNLSNLILEGSKVKILVEKLGLSQTTAETLQKICGNLSVWIANKILDTSAFGPRNRPSYVSIEPETINGYVSNFILKYRSIIVGIIDYVRVHLNGDISSIKHFSLSQLTALQHEWHHSLQIGTGNINYDEKNVL